MTWNWQHKNWPNFEYDIKEFADYERDFIFNSGQLYGSLKHIDDEEQQSLKIDLLSNEAFKTSEIEGDILNRDSLQSSIRKQLGLKTELRKASPAENGIAEMMVSVYNNYKEPLSHGQLFEWHLMLTNGRRDLLDIGQYRTHEEPMQVVSGRYDRNIVHYEAPPSSQVSFEMNRFLEWFNSTQQTLGKTSPLVRSGIAHLYFESIHPFEDGNGRIGRAISIKAISQSLGRPTLIAISQIIEQEKKKYYNALQSNSVDLELNDWLKFYCEVVLKAQTFTQNLIGFLISKAKFYHRFDNNMNERQRKAVYRIFKEGLDGFTGGLSAENYVIITKASASTATRDLQKLIEMGALTKQGKLKSTRYFLNLESTPISQISTKKLRI